MTKKQIIEKLLSALNEAQQALEPALHHNTVSEANDLYDEVVIGCLHQNPDGDNQDRLQMASFDKSEDSSILDLCAMIGCIVAEGETIINLDPVNFQ